jgi:hypothetical protein
MSDATSPRPARTSLARVVSRLAATLAVLVLTLVVTEIVSRWVAPQTVQVGFANDRVPLPYTVFGPRQVDGAVRVNRLGYRGPVPAVPKRDEFRVFVLGGSTVFLGKPALPELLQDRLRERGFDRVHVYNWGAVAASSGMEVARLAFEIGDFQPDLVVQYDGGNDVSTPFLYDPRPGYPLNFVVTERNPLLRSDLATYPTWTLFAYGSNLARILFPSFFTGRFLELDDLRREQGYGTAAWEDQIARIYVANLVRSARIAGGFGALYMGFFQPLIQFKPSLSDDEKRVKDLLIDYLTNHRAAEFDAHANRMRERVLARVAALGGIPKVVDLSGIFAPTTESIYTDFIHVNRAGNERIATAVAESLLADAVIRRGLEAHGRGPRPVSGAAARAVP